MKDYIMINKFEDTISLAFYIEEEKILRIGAKMNEINTNAYMNGYNWEAFFNYYLEKNHPDIYRELESDPEAGMYAVYFKNNSDNEKKVEKLADIIEDLIENEEKLYQLIESHGEEIEWD